ncbi:MDR family NADP-dependent oxidoreductase [Streptomyces sp. NPDC059874]|uniref:MDR family NADP-dependent oxidoreductase n=1 Tax=Streptomyces sp. NPDC059874 TaxID=3346983 RepID=UPI00365A67C4
MPTAALPRTALEVRLASVPEGLPEPRHFTLAEASLPIPEPGQVLVRNRHFLVFPGLRTLIGGRIEGLPLPTLAAGDTLFGPAVGEVVAAPGDGTLRAGDLVFHMAGWRDHALLPAGQVTPLDPGLPTPVAHLAQGSAPYGALTRLARVRPGDVVLVSGAAGAVGTLAGQIARLLGAAKVIGSTRSPHKADRLVRELGYDHVLVEGPGQRPLADRLREAAPEGLDVVLDSVGGAQLSAALGAARQGARVALVGALSGQLAPGTGGAGAPAEIDTFHLVIRGVSLAGYAGADHPGVEAEWTGRFGGWLRSGEIRFPYTEIEGMRRATAALPELIAGRHFGAVVVRL